MSENESPLSISFDVPKLTPDVIAEIRAIGHITAILEGLDRNSRLFVMDYLNSKYQKRSDG